ncbi:MAG: winged helix-turn-helix transcriptional regulator [Armatimonadetes bacterium]|nr:winged helix-turn-helix transcriptional regulator [Armatimonadota bacterium]
MECLDSTLSELGLTQSTFDLLSAINAAGENASQADVARRLSITPPSLSESVRNAVKLGLIEQIPSSIDARVKVIRLTFLGKEKLERVVHSLNKIEEKCVNGVNQLDLRVATKVLRQATNNLSNFLATS